MKIKYIVWLLMFALFCSCNPSADQTTEDSSEELTSSDTLTPNDMDKIDEMKVLRSYAIASKFITEKHYLPVYAYRERPDDKQDSGWHFFSGSESEEDIENPDNFGLYELEDIIALDPSLSTIVDAEVGHYYEKFDKEWHLVETLPDSML